MVDGAVDMAREVVETWKKIRSEDDYYHASDHKTLGGQVIGAVKLMVECVRFFIEAHADMVAVVSGQKLDSVQAIT